MATQPEARVFSARSVEPEPEPEPVREPEPVFFRQGAPATATPMA
jgi:hypothetical protein